MFVVCLFQTHEDLESLFSLARLTFCHKFIYIYALPCMQGDMTIEPLESFLTVWMVVSCPCTMFDDYHPQLNP